MTTCNRPKCTAQVFWGRTEANNRRMPVDIHPVDDGNVLIVSRPGEAIVLRVLKKGENPPDEVSRYAAHFVTCADPPPRKPKK